MEGFRPNCSGHYRRAWFQSLAIVEPGQWRKARSHRAEREYWTSGKGPRKGLSGLKVKHRK